MQKSFGMTMEQFKIYSDHLTEDGIYSINYKGAAFVKRLQRDKDCVRIISDNSKYKEMTEGDESHDFRVVGKVRYVMHKVQG